MKIKSGAEYFVIIIAAIFISSVVLLSACSGNNNQSSSPDPSGTIDPGIVNNPASASGNNEKGKVPVLQFDNPVHDFGTITQGEKISFAFKFKNVGNGDLLIRAAQGSCGCTVPEFPKGTIHPGGDGIINVTFNSEGKEGQQHKTVTVISNTMPNTYTLEITGNVIKPE